MKNRAIRHVISSSVLVIATLMLAACDRGGAEAILTPEQPDQFTIGLISNNPNGLRNVSGFQEGMAELGYVEGENVTYIFEETHILPDNLDATLQSMVEAQVDLIFTAGTPTGVAAHRLTEGTNIPVVFGVIADPIAAGVLEDLDKPGGNMTGVRLSDNQARRLELLLDMVPDAQRIFIAYNPEDAAPSSAVAQVNELAPRLGIEIVTAHAQNDDEVTQLLANIPADIDAIFMVPDSVVNARLTDLLAVATEHQLPVSGPSVIQVENGALMTYGFVHHEVGKQASHIADQVLKGADPGELPIQTAEFLLVVNLKAAESIGLEVSDEFLQQAKLVIRD